MAADANSVIMGGTPTVAKTEPVAKKTDLDIAKEIVLEIISSRSYIRDRKAIKSDTPKDYLVSYGADSTVPERDRFKGTVEERTRILANFKNVSRKATEFANKIKDKRDKEAQGISIVIEERDLKSVAQAFADVSKYAEELVKIRKREDGESSQEYRENKKKLRTALLSMPPLLNAQEMAADDFNRDTSELSQYLLQPIYDFYKETYEKEISDIFPENKDLGTTDSRKERNVNRVKAFAELLDLGAKKAEERITFLQSFLNEEFIDSKTSKEELIKRIKLLNTTETEINQAKEAALASDEKNTEELATYDFVLKEIKKAEKLYQLLEKTGNVSLVAGKNQEQETEALNAITKTAQEALTQNAALLSIAQAKKLSGLGFDIPSANKRFDILLADLDSRLRDIRSLNGKDEFKNDLAMLNSEADRIISEIENFITSLPAAVQPQMASTGNKYEDIKTKVRLTKNNFDLETVKLTGQNEAVEAEISNLLAEREVLQGNYESAAKKATEAADMIKLYSTAREEIASAVKFLHIIQLGRYKHLAEESTAIIADVAAQRHKQNHYIIGDEDFNMPEFVAENPNDGFWRALNYFDQAKARGDNLGEARHIALRHFFDEDESKAMMVIREILLFKSSILPATTPDDDVIFENNKTLKDPLASFAGVAKMLTLMNGGTYVIKTEINGVSGYKLNVPAIRKVIEGEGKSNTAAQESIYISAGKLIAEFYKGRGFTEGGPYDLRNKLTRALWEKNGKVIIPGRYALVRLYETSISYAATYLPTLGSMSLPLFGFTSLTTGLVLATGTATAAFVGNFTRHPNIELPGNNGFSKREIKDVTKTQKAKTISLQPSLVTPEPTTQTPTPEAKTKIGRAWNKFTEKANRAYDRADTAVRNATNTTVFTLVNKGFKGAGNLAKNTWGLYVTALRLYKNPIIAEDSTISPLPKKVNNEKSKGEGKKLKTLIIGLSLIVGGFGALGASALIGTTVATTSLLVLGGAVVGALMGLTITETKGFGRAALILGGVANIGLGLGGVALSKGKDKSVTPPPPTPTPAAQVDDAKVATDYLKAHPSERFVLPTITVDPKTSSDIKSLPTEGIKPKEQQTEEKFVPPSLEELKGSKSTAPAQPEKPNKFVPPSLEEEQPRTQQLYPAPTNPSENSNPIKPKHGKGSAEVEYDTGTRFADKYARPQTLEARQPISIADLAANKPSLQPEAFRIEQNSAGYASLEVQTSSKAEKAVKDQEDKKLQQASTQLS